MQVRAGSFERVSSVIWFRQGGGVMTARSRAGNPGVTAADETHRGGHSDGARQDDETSTTKLPSRATKPCQWTNAEIPLLRPLVPDLSALEVM